MRTKKAILLLLSLLLAATLCSCGKKDATLPNEGKFSISLQTTAGTGYYWDCVLSEKGIVNVESIQDIPDDLSSGTSTTTTFFFTGKKHGTVTATFYCRQSWDDTVFYQHTCDMEVDWDKTITGELSRQTATIRPGDKAYRLSSTDSSVALWSSEDDVSFTFSPLRSGFTTLTFTPLDDPTASIRSFYLRVADDNTFTITEQSGPINTGYYTSLADLEKSVGFFMDAPKSAVLNEISSVGGMAYVDFTWNHTRFSFVGGELDLNAFLTPDADTLMVGKCEVVVSGGSNTVAAWKADNIVYFISCEDLISHEDLLMLLNEILMP